MDIFRIVGIGLVGAVSYILLKDTRPEIAVLINIVCACLIMFIVVNYLAEIISVLNTLVLKTGVDTKIVGGIIKIIGVGYITEFGAGICEDASAKSIADKILFGGKVVIMLLSLPILTALVQLIGAIMA